ncbi:MAG: vitamin K epoxide reductase family protein [Jiangellales bacterium]
MATTTAPGAEAVHPADDREATPSADLVSAVRTAWLMVVLGTVGLGASIALMIERIAVATDPDYVPTCSINPIVTCTSAMLSPQGEVFGFPNPLLGVAGFPVIIATGAAMLAGARMQRWYWTGLWLGGLGAVAFMHWLIVESLFSIEALCPYCMVVWVATTPLFAVVSAYALPRGALGDRVARSTVIGDLLALRWWLVGLWFVVLAAMIGIVFLDEWRALL